MIQIAQSAKINNTSTIGAQCAETLSNQGDVDESSLFVRIGERSSIGFFNVIYMGVTIGDDVIVEDYNTIGPFSRIGSRSRICYRSHIGDNVFVGENCVIGGFVCDGSNIGDGSRIFGSLVHEQATPQIGWWDVFEDAPKLGVGVVVGTGATVVGGVEIGDHCYVTAGAIVTKTIPSRSIVVETNGIIPIEKWTGQKLRSWIRHVQST